VVSSFIKRAASCVALFLLAATPPVAVLFPLAPAAQAKMRQATLTIEPAAGGSGHSFKIEVAATEQEKELGLMFRTRLGDDEGMLFPYEAARSLSMWMHNTYIPLDMIFIRPDGTIARIEERAEPLSDRVISSGSAVLAVLEIAGGASARLGIKPGDRVRYPLFERGTAR
jgi:uncharacterized membrane protein (UPF0127 family)